MIYESYTTLQGNNCISSCLYNYLRYYGKAVIESDIFFIGKGLNVHFSDEDFGKYYVSNFTNKVNLRGEEFTELSSDLIENSIYNEDLITIGISTKILKYNDIFTYGIESRHCVNLIGLTNDKKQIYISDGFIPTNPISVYSGWIERESFLKHADAWIHNKNDMKQFLLNRQELDELVSQEIYDGIEFIMDNKNEESRIAVLKKLSDDFAFFKYKERDDILNLIKKITFGSLFVGCLHLRELFIEKRYEVGLQQINLIIDNYYILRSLLIKASFMNSEKKCISVSKYLNKIAELETEIFENLRKFI